MGQLCNNFIAVMLAQRQKLTTDSLDLRPAPFRSQDKNLTEGKRCSGFYSRKYDSSLLSVTMEKAVIYMQEKLTAAAFTYKGSTYMYCLVFIFLADFLNVQVQINSL